jgi:hypothetical protein
MGPSVVQGSCGYFGKYLVVMQFNSVNIAVIHTGSVFICIELAETQTP